MNGFRPYFTLTEEARRLQREDRHAMWCNEEYWNTRRMLRVGLLWCIFIIAVVLAAAAKARGLW